MAAVQSTPSVLRRKAASPSLYTQARPWIWVAVFAGAGILHFRKEETYNTIVPESLPGTARQWTRGSGVVELLLAAALATPRTRPLAAKIAAAFLGAVWPANMKMAWDWRRKPLVPRAVAWGRVPLQIPMIRDMLSLSRSAERAQSR